MKVRLAERHWLVAAGVLAIGVPVIALAGLAFTLAVAALVQVAGLAAVIPLNPWLWMLGFVVTSASLWFFARWCARAGGWKALGTGVAAIAAIALVAWLLGTAAQRASGGDVLAGVGSEVFGLAIALFGLVAAACGVIALLTDPSRQPPPLDAEDE